MSSVGHPTWSMWWFDEIKCVQWDWTGLMRSKFVQLDRTSR